MNSTPPMEFALLVQRVVDRFFAQNGQPAPAAMELEAFTGRIWALISRRGLPPPLAPGDPGRPADRLAAESAGAAADLVDPGSTALFAEAARQLVKTCFYPEFRNCRDTFRAVSPDGVCRRQQLDRARGRISGSHCVDCPHWLRLPPAQHAAFLALEWRGDSAEFQAHRGTFLPEDFRALRTWIRTYARAPGR